MRAASSHSTISNDMAPQAREGWPQAGRFEAALLTGNQREAFRLVTECLEAGHTLVDIELKVIRPSLYAIGEKWQTNKISVATEHLATAISQSAMTLGLMRSTPLDPNGKRVLLACVQGNIHALGSRMVADAFELAGWTVQYLGPNVPSEALVEHIVEWKPDLVALSASFAHQLPVVKDVIGGARLAMPSGSPPILIGGRALDHFSEFAPMVGADGYAADPASAVIYGREVAAR